MMNSLKNSKLFLLVLVFATILAACGGGGETGSSDGGSQSGGSTETKNLIFALDQGPTDTWVRATEEFARLVEEKTDGSVKIAVHHSGTLGSQRELLEGILSGTVDGAVTLEPLSYWVEEINLFGIPYLFDDQEHLDSLMASEDGEELNQKITEAGFHPLTYFDRPPRQITSNKEINTLEDLSGLRIRVPETATAPPAFEAMGAAPTAMAFSELYNALDQGVIDAQENPIPTIYSNNLHEVQEYLAFTNHSYQPVYLVIGEEAYNSLTDEEKEAVNEAAEETKQYEKEILAEDIEGMRSAMEESGMTFTEPDTAEFSEAAQQAYSGYDPLMQEWIQRIQDLK